MTQPGSPPARGADLTKRQEQTAPESDRLKKCQGNCLRDPWSGKPRVCRTETTGEINLLPRTSHLDFGSPIDSEVYEVHPYPLC